MPYHIDIEAMVDVPPGAITAVQQAITIALDRMHSEPDGELAVVLANDAYLHTLNRQFRQEDHPTDVLSFPTGEPLPGLPGPSLYLGDIAISLPYAQRQAERQGHALIEELQLLAVHGVLHLFGHDHDAEEEKQEMWRHQSGILKILGLSHVQPTEGDDGP